MEVVVFTNGCFDIIHSGHVELLEKAKAFGTKLIVGINSDESVRQIKGIPRPFVNQSDRAEVLMSMRTVDEVKIFDETTPEKLIREIKPDILVKGGDWNLNQIIGSDFVLSGGGKVYSIPLKKGYSSTDIVNKILYSAVKDNAANLTESVDAASKSLRQHIEIFERLQSNNASSISRCAEIMANVLKNKKKILICGNGGSAADAQHFSAELVGRFERERKALPAIALTTDTSALTAVGNDYGFERIFARQVEALAAPGDLFVGISTSGNSPNVIAAAMAARSIGCQTVGLTGSEGKKLASLCDASVLVPADRTSRIQEAHITVIHIWCEMIDESLCATL